MLRTIKHLPVVIYSSAATATNMLKPVLAPAGETLSFASPSHMDVVNAENAGAFFRKRKYPKKRRPGCRLLPALWRFYRGLPKPFGNARLPCRAPSGYSRQKRQSSLRHTVINHQLRNISYLS
jgi:hypothetical protein